MKSASQSQNAFSPRVLLLAISRRKTVFVLVLLVSAAATALMVRRARFRYESSFDFLVKPGVRERFSLDQASLRGDPVAGSSFPSTSLANAVSILQSPDLVGRLVDELLENGEMASPVEEESPPDSRKNDLLSKALRKFLRPPEVSLPELSDAEQRREALKAMLVGAIKVEATMGPSVITVSVNWSDPHTAYRLARRLVDVCRLHYVEAYRPKASIQFLEKLVQSAEAKLQDTIKKQSELLVDLRVSDIDRRMKQIESRIATLEDQHGNCQIRMASYDGEARAIEKSLESVNKELPDRVSVIANPKHAALYGHLQSLNMMRLDRPKIAGTSTPLDREIERVLKKLEKEPELIEKKHPAGPDPIYTTLRRKLLTVDAERAGLMEQCGRITSELETLRLISSKLYLRSAQIKALDLERELASADLRSHKMSLQAARKIDLLSRGEFSNLQLIRSPELNPGPVKNRRPMFLAAGLLGGLAAAAFLCFLLYQASSEFSRPDDLRRTIRARVLGSVPACTRRNLFLLRYVTTQK
jgi:uncharacterized protein involved in exopolysaccharide biosynthesis